MDEKWNKFIEQIIIRKDSEGYGDDNSICPICMEKQRNIIFLPCKHLFCDSCTKIIKKGDCPICRRTILYNYDYTKIHDTTNNQKDDK